MSDDVGKSPEIAREPSHREARLGRLLLVHNRVHPWLSQWRYASIHSAPSGGGLGSGRSRMGRRCRTGPREQIAAIWKALSRSTRSTVTGTPRNIVSKG